MHRDTSKQRSFVRRNASKKRAHVQNTKCPCYGYLPSRNRAKALAKEWECSSNEWNAPQKHHAQHPSSYLELLAIACTSWFSRQLRRTVPLQRDSCKWHCYHAHTCDNVCAQVELGDANKQTNQTNKVENEQTSCHHRYLPFSIYRVSNTPACGWYSKRFHRGMSMRGMLGIASSKSCRSLSSFSSQTASCMPTRWSLESRTPKLRITWLLNDFCSDSGTNCAIVGTSIVSSRSSIARACSITFAVKAATDSTAWFLSGIEKDESDAMTASCFYIDESKQS